MANQNPNLLIGHTANDTLNNIEAALSVLQGVNLSEEIDDRLEFGLFLLLGTVREAAREAERQVKRGETLTA